MSSKFELADPEGAIFTLTVSMSLRDWVKVNKSLDSPEGVKGWALRQAVNEMVEGANKHFYPKAKTAEKLS